VWATDRLAHDWPGAAGHPELPAGVLAISISQVHRHVVLWFRPEVVRSVQWAGDPRKAGPDDEGRIHPRRSFASWREELRGRSEPWPEATLAAADELRHALIGIVLRRAEELAEVAAELGRVNKELEAFSYTVSHDLRAPMRHIAGYIDLVQDLEGKQLSPRAGRYLAHVREAATYAGRLVDALLDFSRMGRAAIKPARVDTALLVQELAAEIDRQEVPRRIAWDIGSGLPVLWADPLLVQAALRNLLGNAAKYTRGRDVARVTVRAVSRPDGQGLEIEDNGVGFQQKYAGKLFGVFQRLHRVEDFEGTGIGLALAQRVVERHGGTISADSTLGEGATFTFVMPKRDEEKRQGDVGRG
jgi:light-regulated signal transduction histidine kinase (bacteriophytochrome)